MRLSKESLIHWYIGNCNFIAREICYCLKAIKNALGNGSSAINIVGNRTWDKGLTAEEESSHGRIYPN